MENLREKNCILRGLCPWMFSLLTLITFVAAGCSDDKEELEGDMITMDDAQLSHSLEAEETSVTLHFTARSSWTATVNEESDWVTLSPTSGIGGSMTVTATLTTNMSEAARTATVTITCRQTVKQVTINQAGTTVKIMDEADVQDFNKYYKPAEFSNVNMLRSDAKWSWWRSKQSEHFFVFWEEGFGDDPNSSSLDASMRVDIDDLLEKAEQFYHTNIETLKFAELGQGKSYLDQYKMEIYLLYQTEWLATGSGYDDVIGALWVNPSTCQPVGSTIAHEIGHSFQYQVYCDKLLQGEPNDFHQGFRYGYEGSNGGNGFWEQCAQWQSYQDYPEQMFADYYYSEWFKHNHRHFEHEWMRYASYWLQTYWTAKHGQDAVARVWKESAYPEDAISAYMRIYNENSWETTSAELWDYAARMATFDIDGMREYAGTAQDQYSTELFNVGDGYYQVSYANCPGSTGFNVIALKVPEGGSSVTADFVGLAPGSALAAEDEGNYMESEAVAGQVSQYNDGSDAEAGWRYGFVALQQDGTRVYSEMNSLRESTASWTVPANTENLYFVVQGMPTVYRPNPWDEDERTDLQFPYRVRFGGTTLKGNVDIDETAEPRDTTLTISLKCDASAADYVLGTIDLAATDALQAIAQAFVMQPSSISANTLAIVNGSTVEPSEGKIAFGLLQTDGTYSYTYTSNAGFYCTAEGNQGSWSNSDPIWLEYDKDTFTLTYGHYPGQTEAGKKYTVKPTFVYTKDGVAYHATLVLEMQF